MAIDLCYQDSSGALKRTAVYGRTQAEARAKAKELRKRLELGQPVRDTADTSAVRRRVDRYGAGSLGTQGQPQSHVYQRRP